MEGNAQWEACDEEAIDPRFQMLATTDFETPKRTTGNWYTATCPIVSPVGKLGPTDYFGRTMVAYLPQEVKVGVVAVAIGGCNILMFDKIYRAACRCRHCKGCGPAISAHPAFRTECSNAAL